MGAAGIALALAASCAKEGPVDYDLSALASALGEASGRHVAPEDIRWEPSDGAVVDYVVGRRVLFLGSEAPGAPRDVFRAHVRVTPEGRPVAVRAPFNLTSTPLGDDHALVVRERRAAFATLAYGQEHSVSVLELDGEQAANEPKAFGWADRAMRYLTNLQQTGSGRGVGRVEVTLDPPAQSVGLALDEAGLAIEVRDVEGEKRARLDPVRAELQPAFEGMRAEAVPHLPKRFVFWAVDTVRAISFIGPAPIAWLEDKVFGVKDTVKRIAWGVGGTDDALAEAAPPAPVLDASKVAEGDVEWPPADIPSMWKKPEKNEGVWQTPKLPWLKRLPLAPVAAAASALEVAAKDDAATPTAPLPFARTFVRPDEKRPYASVTLVAMDMRQLELQMEAGSEDPKPLTGGHGPGRIPRDPAIASRVVAAFNGAFKTEHGTYGMMVKKRVLLPPQPGAATVVVLKDGRAGFGSWGNTTEITGIHGVADDDIESFRQNLDPLIDRGEINPTKRTQWGFTLPGNGTQTERSGLCVTAAGHLVYAWGEDVSATTLAQAMKMASCVYGMHLDMNPHHTGFLYTRIDDIKAHKTRSELLASEMGISQDRYIDFAAKDFFYVLLRDPTPAPLDEGGGDAWRPSPGAQPAPTWLAAIHEARSTKDRVDLVSIDAGRAAYRIRAGVHEPDAGTGASPLRDLAPDDAQRVLLAVGLGVSLDKHPRGLGTGGRMVLPVRGAADSALLVASADGGLSILRPTEFDSLGPNVDLAEVRLLFDESGVPAAIRGYRGTIFPRAALGITAGGRVLVARASADNEVPLAERSSAPAACAPCCSIAAATIPRSSIAPAPTRRPARVTTRRSSTRWAARSSRAASASTPSPRWRSRNSPGRFQSGG